MRTVGALGAGAFKAAAFDIADVSGAAFAALTPAGASASRWVDIDLRSQHRETVRCAAIEP